MKSDNSKIILRWELQQSGIENAMDHAIKAADGRHPAIHRVLWDGRRDLRPHLDILGSAMTEEMRYDYPLNSNSVVLDAGGYRGDWAAEINRRYGCGVIVLEPIKEFYHGIVARFEGNPKVKAFNFGLGAISGTAEFGVQNDSTGRFAGSTQRETVRIETVEDVFAQFGGSDIDLFKLNIEGAEHDVIERLLDTGLIAEVKNLQVQFHDCATDSVKRYAVIQERLAETHRLTFYAGWVWQNWERT